MNIQSFLIKIFNNNNIMFYIVIPIFLLVFKWIKDAWDIKVKNKKLGYWIIKYKKIKTFIDVLFVIYKALALLLILIYIIKIIISFYGDIFILQLLTGLLYWIVGIVIIFFVCNKAYVKAELLTKKRIKWKFVWGLYFIFGLSTFVEMYIMPWTLIIGVLFTILLLVWMVLAFNNFDLSFILYKSYADIYIKGSEPARGIVAGSIKKQGEWIIARIYKENAIEEIRILECDIVRIDYYGEPIVVIEKHKIF